MTSQPTTEKKCEECGRDICRRFSCLCTGCHGHQPEEVKCDGRAILPAQKNCKICTDNGCETHPCPGCSACAPKREGKYRHKNGCTGEMCHCNPEPVQPPTTEGWERRLHEILIGEVWATNNYSSPEEAIKDLIHQVAQQAYERGMAKQKAEDALHLLKVRREAEQCGYDRGLEDAEGAIRKSLEADGVEKTCPWKTPCWEGTTLRLPLCDACKKERASFALRSLRTKV